MLVDASEAVRNTHAWFEVNSGWAPPDPQTLAEWMGDGMCRCPDECVVVPEGWCEHGLASWWLVLGAAWEDVTSDGPDARLNPHDPGYNAIVAAHRDARERNEAGYLDPTTGLFVLTSPYLWARGQCCDQGCRHCPYRA